MSKLKFTLSFHGGKAEQQKVSASVLARIFQGISDDIENVCRVITSDDVEVDLKEIIESTNLYVVAEPQIGSLILNFETDDAPFSWVETAGHIYAQGLNDVKFSDDLDQLPKGITASMLKNAVEYSSPPNAEYKEMRFHISENGLPAATVVFNSQLKVAATRELLNLQTDYDNTIHGYDVEGTLFGIVDEHYDNPKAHTVNVTIKANDGMKWACSVSRDLLPEDLNDIFTKRVLASGTATFRSRRSLLEIEKIEVLDKIPDIETAISDFVRLTSPVFEGVDLAEYMQMVRERD